MATLTFRSRPRTKHAVIDVDVDADADADAEVVGEENIDIMALLYRKRNADDAFDCRHFLDYFSVHEPCNKRVRYIDDRVSTESTAASTRNEFEKAIKNIQKEYDAITVIGEVLEHLVGATSISLSIFPYLGGCRELVEDEDFDDTNKELFLNRVNDSLISAYRIPSPSYDDDDDADDKYDEYDEDHEDDNSQMNGSNSSSSNSSAGSLPCSIVTQMGSNNDSDARPSIIVNCNNDSDDVSTFDDEDDSNEHFLNQEFKHIDSKKKERLIGPYRARVSFVKHNHLVVDYRGQRFRSLDKHSDRLIVAVDHSEAGLRRMVDSNTDDFRLMCICDEILPDDEKMEAESSAARGPRYSTEGKGMTKGSYNSVKGTHLYDVKIQRCVKPPSVFALTSKKCNEKGCLDCHHQLDQNTMEYRYLIELSHLASKNRNRWLSPNKIDDRRNVSILKSTTIFPQRTTVHDIYAGNRHLAVALPPPILHKSKKRKKKKSRAYGDVIPPAISYPSKEVNDWKFLPTRAFANVLSFLESPERKRGYTVCRQWTIKFRKMNRKNYPLSRLLGIMSTLNLQFVDTNCNNFPMDKLMAGSSKKEVRFSKQCYEKEIKNLCQIHEENKKDPMFKEERKDPWFGVHDCSWKFVYGVDHEEREEQLVWYMRSYDIHEEASSIGRERMLGGKIKTVSPRISMPCVTMKAAIQWENYVNYINEKSAIFNWKKSGIGKWVRQVPNGTQLKIDGPKCFVPISKFLDGYIEVGVDDPVPKFPDRYVEVVVDDTRLSKALKISEKTFEEWKLEELKKLEELEKKKKKHPKGKKVKIDDTDSDTTVVRESKRTDTNNNNTNAVGAAVAGTTSSSALSVTTRSVTSTQDPSLPSLRGILSYNSESRQHLIRGMWNFENSDTFPAQKFELLRKLTDDETDTDLTSLPKDGEFHGSFDLVYYHTSSKGKRKERFKVVTESGVKIKFTKTEDSINNNDYKVDGTGVNEFGTFHIDGTAKPTPTHDDDGQYSIELRKRYDAKYTIKNRSNIKKLQKCITEVQKEASVQNEGGKKKRKPIERTRQTNEFFSRSKSQLHAYGLKDANKSPFSGDDMYYPKSVKKEEYYKFVRLVKKPSDEVPTRFYCFLCEEEYVYSAGNTNQLSRHNTNFTKSHADKLSALGGK
jgi:hypothetical protein